MIAPLKSATPSIGEIVSVTRGNLWRGNVQVGCLVFSGGKLFESKTWKTYRKVKVKVPHSFTLTNKKKFHSV